MHSCALQRRVKGAILAFPSRVAWLPSALLALHHFVYQLPRSRLERVLEFGDYANMALLYESVSDIKENTRADSGTEDELSAPSKLSRVTPRNSSTGQASPAVHDINTIRKR